MTNHTQPQGVHLVGSIPLENSRAVFEMAGPLLGNHIRRIPDGETGERTNWIQWQLAVLKHTPQLDAVTFEADDYGNVMTQVKIGDGFTAEQISFGALGYAAAAQDSYARFAELKLAGKIPARCRFQVSLPTPLAPIHFYVVPADRVGIEQAYETKLLAELDEILATVPATELAIQWDTAVEFGILEGVFPTYLADPETEIPERLVRLGNKIPAEVEVGYHLCYGDSGHKHFVEPKDTAMLVMVANGISAGIERSLNWIHLPVPSNRVDEAYYAPLKQLALPTETELYLGLVHMSDGAAGTQKRIQAALTAVSQFGVATECGFGRRPAATIPALMQIHTAVAHRLSGV